MQGFIGSRVNYFFFGRSARKYAEFEKIKKILPLLDRNFDFKNIRY